MTSVSFVRRKEVRVSFELVVHVLTKGTEFHTRIVSGLPDGARLVRIDTRIHEALDEPTAEAVLVFEHESFEPTAPGERMPILTPKVERVDCEAPGAN